jgi:hypothetical protein
MDDLELFDVFSADNNPEPAQKTITGHSREKVTKTTRPRHENSQVKDKANGKRSYHDSAENGAEEDFDRDDIAPSKRSRKVNENPIVVDSFETESDQIVPVAQGLQGIPAPPDENIIIKKRVTISPQS